MIALIINSGIGSRMGELTKNEPKCMTSLLNDETILERQLKQLVYFGIKKAVVTTGYLEDKIIEHCKNIDLPIEIKFVKNEKFKETNYIYFQSRSNDAYTYKTDDPDRKNRPISAVSFDEVLD